MSMRITSLNSGSNGNCYYLGNEKEAVLIDAGISCRETEIRMKRLGLSMQNLRAIFVSHEHSDHIAGIPVLSKKYKLPVYISRETLKFSGLKIEKNLVHFFEPHDAVSVGDISILPFPKFHDASDPYSFVVSCSGTRVGV